MQHPTRVHQLSCAVADLALFSWGNRRVEAPRARSLVMLLSSVSRIIDHDMPLVLRMSRTELRAERRAELGADSGD